jgi:hypothetical protein
MFEGFLSYKPKRTKHEDDARRLVDEFAVAERFLPCNGSQPICEAIKGVSEIRRYNLPEMFFDRRFKNSEEPA